MWEIELPHWWDFIVRAAVVYICSDGALAADRQAQIGQLVPFDLVLLLVLSNAVQNSMNGGDNSITGGLILATTLIILNLGVSWITFHSKRVEALIEGRPIILIHNGCIDHRAMRKVQMTKHELEASLRSEGCAGPEAVRLQFWKTTDRSPSSRGMQTCRPPDS